MSQLNPTDVIVCGAPTNIKLCDDCIDAYRNGIEPGESHCEDRYRAKIAKQLREMISSVGSIQNSAGGPIQSGYKRVGITTLEIIKDDADKLRVKIRELAQMIGVEY